LAKKTTAFEVIEALGLEKSPTGGSWYKHVHSSDAHTCSHCGNPSDRSQSTSFIYLLEKNTLHEWHRFNSSLIWTHLGGDGAELSACDQNLKVEKHILDGDVLSSPSPVKVIDSQLWMRIRTLGDWSLVNCTHASGFEFGQLEIAEAGWMPKDGPPKLRFPAAG